MRFLRALAVTSLLVFLVNFPPANASAKTVQGSWQGSWKGSLAINVESCAAELFLMHEPDALWILMANGACPSRSDLSLFSQRFEIQGSTLLRNGESVGTYSDARIDFDVRATSDNGEPYTFQASLNRLDETTLHTSAQFITRPIDEDESTRFTVEGMLSRVSSDVDGAFEALSGKWIGGGMILDPAGGSIKCETTEMTFQTSVTRVIFEGGFRNCGTLHEPFERVELDVRGTTLLYAGTPVGIFTGGLVHLKFESTTEDGTPSIYELSIHRTGMSTDQGPNGRTPSEIRYFETLVVGQKLVKFYAGRLTRE